MLSPTKRGFQEALLTPPAERVVPDFKKWQVILFNWVQKIIMAKLQADQDNPVTYNICDTSLTNPQFWVKLTNALPVYNLTEEIKRRASNFL